MSDKIDKETHQAQNPALKSDKSIDPVPVKAQSQSQNKSHSQTNIVIENKVQEIKVQQGHKVEEKNEQKPQEQHQSKQQIIKQYIKTHKIQIDNHQLTAFVKQENLKSTPFDPNNLSLWIQAQKNKKKELESQKQQQPKSKTEIISKKQIKDEEQVKSEVKAQLTNIQIINIFFKKLAAEQVKQINQDIIQALNRQINSKLQINSQRFEIFLKSGNSKSFEIFKQWLIKYEQDLIQQWNNKFSKSFISKEIDTHLNKLKAIIDLADQNKSNLNINLGVGENKGKTTLKMGMFLKSTKQSNFNISFQVKIKKKLQLRHFIQNQIKKLNKSDDLGLFKFCKIKFEQTQKSLKIQLSSQVFETHVLQQFTQFLQKKFKGQDNPILKAQIEVNIKNSIRQDENLLQNKRFIKWLAQGFTSSIKIQGNSKIVQHFSSPLADYFPIFKVVRSGDVCLKLNKIQNVDKLFDKLGINQISQETPPLQRYFQVMVKQQLDSNTVIWVGDIIKYILLFACIIPNQRISIDVHITLSHILLFLNISAQACKQLGELVSKTNVENFS